MALFAESRLRRALDGPAQRTLQRLADDPTLRERSLRRFQRDEPPPYESSTDEEQDVIRVPGAARFAPPIKSRHLSESEQRLLEAPLTDEEIVSAAARLARGTFYNPKTRLFVEALRQRERFRCFHVFGHKERADRKGLVHRFHDEEDGSAPNIRQEVLIGRLVRRRWQKLGVWNASWKPVYLGMNNSGKTREYFGDASTLRWWWEKQAGAAVQWHESTSPQETLELNKNHPYVRVLKLRQNLSRGEDNRVIPRSSLGPDASAGEAEAFFLSRPWFLHQIEVEEEFERRKRLRQIPYDPEKGHFFALGPDSRLQVNMWWIERGDLPQDAGNNPYIGWKWRHESPSPEPEELWPLTSETFEFNAAEIDILNAAPEELCTYHDPDESKPYVQTLFGLMPQTVPVVRPVPRPRVILEGSQLPNEPTAAESQRPKRKRSGLDDTHQDPGGDSPSGPANTSVSLGRTSRPAKRQRQQRESDPQPTPPSGGRRAAQPAQAPLRRSARIAALAKRSADAQPLPLPTQATPVVENGAQVKTRGRRPPRSQPTSSATGPQKGPARARRAKGDIDSPPENRSTGGDSRSARLPRRGRRAVRGRAAAIESSGPSPGQARTTRKRGRPKKGSS